MPGPTVFPELNGVLAELIEGARSILADNFRGAYLHESFATGDADVFSDVDFLIVTRAELTDEALAGPEPGNLVELEQSRSGRESHRATA